MEKAVTAGAGETPPRRGLSEDIVIWEILVRLPPKPLLRCRAVCHAWRSATSTRDFLLAHHGHQPSLPVAWSYGYEGDRFYRNFFTFDHQAADVQLEHLFRVYGIFYPEIASCDGLVILAIGSNEYCVRNPATNQYVRLQEIDGFNLLGMYHHGPTGEYRLLLYWFESWARYPVSGVPDGPYVFALGSGQPPRHIGRTDGEEVNFDSKSLMFCGGLHWHLSRHKMGNNMIMVFDTTAESFRQMPSPADERVALFEMDGMLAMYRFLDLATNIDIWVLPDYESQVWSFKCRVELPAGKIKAQFDNMGNYRDAVVATSCDGDVFVLVRLGEWLLQIDMDSKLVASFHCKNLRPTQLQIKQSLVPRTFFPAIEGYVMNASANGSVE